MTNKTNELQTSDPAELPSTTKSPKIAFPKFCGKPLAMALPAKTKKGGAGAGPTRGKKAKIPQTPKRASSARFQTKVLEPKVDGSRPSNLILVDGYDSDTRVE